MLSLQSMTNKKWLIFNKKSLIRQLPNFFCQICDFSLNTNDFLQKFNLRKTVLIAIVAVLYFSRVNSTLCILCSVVTNIVYSIYSLLCGYKQSFTLCILCSVVTNIVYSMYSLLCGYKHSILYVFFALWLSRRTTVYISSNFIFAAPLFFFVVFTCANLCFIEKQEQGLTH